MVSKPNITCANSIYVSFSYPVLFSSFFFFFFGFNLLFLLSSSIYISGSKGTWSSGQGIRLAVVRPSVWLLAAHCAHQQNTISHCPSPLSWQKRGGVPEIQRDQLRHILCHAEFQLGTTLKADISVKCSATCTLISQAGCSIDQINWNPHCCSQRGAS